MLKQNDFYSLKHHLNLGSRVLNLVCQITYVDPYDFLISLAASSNFEIYYSNPRLKKKVLYNLLFCYILKKIVRAKPDCRAAVLIDIFKLGFL
jgi:hypothetical protein